MVRTSTDGDGRFAVKIAFVISSLGSGGAERVLTSMANYWVSAGHDVVVVTFSAITVSDFYPLHRDVSRLGLDFRRDTHGVIDKIFFNIKRLKALRDAIRDLGPDAVVSFMDSTNVLSVLACVNRPVVTLISIRNNPTYRRLTLIWRLGRRLTYRYATCVVAQTEGAARWIRKHTAAKVCVIPNPVRMPQCDSVAREKLILAAGRFIPEKGHDLLIDAFARIAEHAEDWQLVILGSGPLEGSLRKQVLRSGLGDRISMPGTVKNVDQWYARCGIFVHASRSEGFPNALVEAMAAGAPVIAADCDFGPADIISDGANGLLVPADDIDSLAKAMRQLIGSSSLRHDLGTLASEVQVRFSQEQIMKIWEAHLQSQTAG